MYNNLKKSSLFLALLFSASGLFSQQFQLKFSKGIVPNNNFTGKIYLYLSKDNLNPKDGMIGFEPMAYYSIAVKNIKADEVITINDSVTSYPTYLSDIERGTYNVQAVWDLNGGGRAIGSTAGNIYNKNIKVKLSKNRDEIFKILCNDIITEEPFVDTEFTKELKVTSPLLTAFYKRPSSINAAVKLPKEYYTQPNRKFPVLFEVSGYGGDYKFLSGRTGLKSEGIDTTACIEIYLDGNCPGGHSVYANSDNNGPWGDALVKELIPNLEQKYRCNGARLLTGHSSGGWTVLWLQTQYPKTFIGCWSSSPDPVDFRSFQRVNLYEDNNMFYKKDSSLRMVATVGGGFPWISMKTIYSAENVIDRGEQMHSFDAVFSVKNDDGTPRRLCNPVTGEIDPVTVKHWNNYDISYYLINNWDKVKNDLDGKIRVTVGNQDNFLLNYAVRKLDEEMKKLNANFTFAYFPGDHFTIGNKEYFTAGHKFLQEKYAEWLLIEKNKKK